MRRFKLQRLACVFLLLSGFAGAECGAQQVTGSLVDLVNSGQYAFNRLEQLSAVANQATYNELTVPSQTRTAPCNVQQTGPSATCPQDVYKVFDNLRELVQTAEELLGGGPRQYSLRLDAQGLGFALRWTAAEELSAPGTASTGFASNQLASLMSRITALRFGARGFSIAGLMPVGISDRALTAQDSRALAVGASGDTSVPDIATRWGGFLDGSFGWGSRAPSDVEDAFNFDGTEVTLGVDYRFTSRLVLGGIAGYSNQRIDFDASKSIVDGGIRSHGFSLSAYGLYDWDGPYVSASLGVQRLSHDSTRKITYPSFNPSIESTNATARGSTHSTTFTATLNAGWSLNHRAFGFEPYAHVEYRNIGINSFRETSVNNAGSEAGQPAGFDFNVDDQSIKSIDAAVGVRFQYTFTPSFGVITPYAKAEYHHEFENNPFSTRTTYDGLLGDNTLSPAATFDLPSDKPDNSFYVVAGGFSLVLKHGIQGFLQYQAVESLDLLTNHAITGGIRGEF